MCERVKTTNHPPKLCLPVPVMLSPFTLLVTQTQAAFCFAYGLDVDDFELWPVGSTILSFLGQTHVGKLLKRHAPAEFMMHLG